MSRATRKYQVVFDSEGGNAFIMILPEGEIKFQLIPNGIYYFGTSYKENIALLINTVVENREGFTRQEYEGTW